MSDDPAATYESLRAETAKMLGLAAALSPTEALRVDLTALLRLQLDALQGAALAGREIDLGKLQSCYAMLSKLLQAVEAAPPAVRESNAARIRLARLIEAQAEVEQDEKDAEIAQLNQLLAEKTAALTALLGSPPAMASPESRPPPKASAPQPASPPPSAPPAKPKPLTARARASGTDSFAAIGGRTSPIPPGSGRKEW
jgi:hypothetical protein